MDAAVDKLTSQCSPVWKTGTIPGQNPRLYRPYDICLNVVRSGRPEQLLSAVTWSCVIPVVAEVSM